MKEKEKEAENLIMESRPVFCKECGGKLFYQNSGIYKCEGCGAEELDAFGKIKQYIEKNGPSSAADIAKETGVKIEIITVFLKDGRLEIPEGSKFFLSCERCGCSLRYGRFCYGCTKELVGQLNGAYFEYMGEQPKSGGEEGKMHFLNGHNVKKKTL